MRKSVDFIEHREKKILALIEQMGQISTAEICRLFELSPSSARNQLNSLAERGLVLRTHGGAKYLNNTEPICVDPSDDFLPVSNGIIKLKEKCAIANAAVKLINEGDIIGISGGSTTHIFARELSRCLKNITVVTNSVLVANELIPNRNIDVRMCGGILNHEKGALTGPMAEIFFRDIYADKLFMGADAVSVKWGVSSGNASISHLESLLAQHCAEKYILVDHSKFDRHMTVDKVLSADKIDAIITDGGISQEVRDTLSNGTVKFIIAE